MLVSTSFSKTSDILVSIFSNSPLCSPTRIIWIDNWGNMPLPETAAIEVGKGQGLGAALSGRGIFPQLSIQMILVGEQSGELENMLTKISDVFENEVETSIMRMTSYLEPVMILVMGMCVLFIVLSICLPIFEMNQLIR